MTLYNFLQLDQSGQADAVWNGVHIGDREEGEYRILLYQLNGTESFYVEAYYHKEHNALHRLRPFKSMDVLELYLNSIDIDKMLNK